jgi:hypothetical protein
MNKSKVIVLNRYKRKIEFWAGGRLCRLDLDDFLAGKGVVGEIFPGFDKMQDYGNPNPNPLLHFGEEIREFLYQAVESQVFE